MKRTLNTAAALLTLMLVTSAIAASPSNAGDAARTSPSMQTASFGAGASPTSIALTVCLVITGAAVVALGAWSGDSAETP